MTNHVRCWDILAAGVVAVGALCLADSYVRRNVSDFVSAKYNEQTAVAAPAPEETTTIRLRQGESFQSLAARCGVAIHDDAIMPSAGSVVYNAFIDALHELNPEQFTRQNVPLPGPYSIPTELCPNQEANR